MDQIFQSAIVADWEDVGPWRIYADWLDEEGRCDEAEAIRLVALVVEGRPPTIQRVCWMAEGIFPRSLEAFQAPAKEWGQCPLLIQARYVRVLVGHRAGKDRRAPYLRRRAGQQGSVLGRELYEFSEVWMTYLNEDCEAAGLAPLAVEPWYLFETLRWVAAWVCCRLEHVLAV